MFEVNGTHVCLSSKCPHLAIIEWGVCTPQATISAFSAQRA